MQCCDKHSSITETTQPPQGQQAAAPNYGNSYVNNQQSPHPQKFSLFANKNRQVTESVRMSLPLESTPFPVNMQSPPVHHYSNRQFRHINEASGMNPPTVSEPLPVNLQSPPIQHSNLVGMEEC